MELRARRGSSPALWHDKTQPRQPDGGRIRSDLIKKDPLPHAGEGRVRVCGLTLTTQATYKPSRPLLLSPLPQAGEGIRGERKERGDEPGRLPRLSAAEID